VAAGPGVDRPAEGDRVVAVWDASRGGLASYVTVDARLAVPWPARLSADEAATISGALLTAYYALHELGRLAAGERVLIHSAAGGVGLAAVQFARLAGAEVLATAGTEAKRAYLRSLGVRHVMDSRSLDFAAEVLASTGGRGVDVVLNSLSGEALTRSFELLAPFGRFLELGKRDLEENRQLMLAPFRENRSFGAVDVDQLIRERPEVAGRLLQEVVGRVADGTLRPLPVTAFPVSRARDAFSHMSQARHTGKIAMSFEEPEAEVLAAASLAPIRPDATYLVTGGFGGLGLQIASRLARLGARHLVLAGRRGAPPEAAAALAALRDAGVEVLVAQVDVADEEALAAMLAAARASMPPLRGVVHGAMVLEDATVAQASWESFQRVLAPKLRGAWNLHRLLGEAQLDFFVLLSSIASLLGSPGQGNYAAGNAFMDALAHHRAADGHPATSINWGPWLEVGGAARRDLADRLAARGLAGIPSEHGLEVFERLLGQARPQVAVMPFDAAVWAGFYPSARHSGLLGLLRGDKTLHDGRRQDSMPFSTDPRKRHRDVERYLREQIARILRLPAVRIHSEGRLTSLGVDSLMAVELRNALEADLGLVVPVVRILQDPTVAELATYVDERLADDLGAAPANAAGTKELLQRIDELSEEEVDELLRELLENAPDAMDGQTPDGADRGTDHATP
jgi:NADPH:quinone reductase-like Zn-dependent oxidoreductase/NADP-dependent 3-hydroxy acid dehydrogenase YdfG/acyl carrier protein